MEIPLFQQFPELSFTKEADKWLELVRNKTISEQLTERKIKYILLVRLKCKGILSVTNNDYFIIQINDNDSIEEKIITLGHEISHTFETEEYRQYGISCRWPEGLCELVEKFCDAFAEKWIVVNDKEKIELFLKNSGKD